MVDREIELTFADLLKRPTIERYVTLSCVSNEVGGDLVGNALSGRACASSRRARRGRRAAGSRRNWSAARSTAGLAARRPSVIMDGRDAMLAIGDERRAAAAPSTATRCGWWSRACTATCRRRSGSPRSSSRRGTTSTRYWVPRGWSKEAPVKTMARIDRPRSKKSYAPTPTGVIDIAGVAWAVHRGHLEGRGVASTSGEWRRVRTGRRAHRRHVAPVAVPVDGARRVITTCARAPTTALASRSRSEPKSVAPDGAQGYHPVRFKVD